MGRQAGLTALLPIVEQALADHPGVVDATVTTLSGGQGPEVVAIVVLSEMCCVLDIREDVKALIDRVGWDTEPGVLAVMELSAQDRLLDESVLLGELVSSPSWSRYEPPATALEADLAIHLARVLDRPRVGVLDDFVDLGGDSLVAITFLHSVQETYGVPLTLVELFSAGTVRQVARTLDERLSIAQPQSG
jgi:hypothetical protein